MTVELTLLISIGCALLGAFFGAMSLRRNSQKDIEESAKTNGIILTEIGYIKSGVDDIKHKQDKQDEKFIKLSERVTTVEASSKQAHKRIDGMVGKVYD